ncbi:MAG: response regulator, partial [Rhodopila sp.]
MNASAPLVLNVDDDAANRYVKTRSLQMGGFQVIEAADGNTALAMTAERQPLLVLLDINLPDLNGLEVCRRIKESWPEIIVIQI